MGSEVKLLSTSAFLCELGWMTPEYLIRNYNNQHKVSIQTFNDEQSLTDTIKINKVTFDRCFEKWKYNHLERYCFTKPL